MVQRVSQNWNSWSWKSSRRNSESKLTWKFFNWPTPRWVIDHWSCRPIRCGRRVSVGRRRSGGNTARRAIGSARIRSITHEIFVGLKNFQILFNLEFHPRTNSTRLRPNFGIPCRLCWDRVVAQDEESDHGKGPKREAERYVRFVETFAAIGNRFRFMLYHWLGVSLILFAVKDKLFYSLLPIASSLDLSRPLIFIFSYFKTLWIKVDHVILRKEKLLFGSKLCQYEWHDLQNLSIPETQAVAGN